jgi:hypothetical protein
MEIILITLTNSTYCSYIRNNIDFVVGSRVARLREKNSMTPQQIFWNWLATTMKIFFNATFTDLGPLEL